MTGARIAPSRSAAATRGRQAAVGGSGTARRWVPAVVALLAVGAVVLAGVATRLPGSPDGGVPDEAALLLLLVLAGFLSLDFRVGGHGNRLDLFDAVLAAALLALPAHDWCSPSSWPRPA